MARRPKRAIGGLYGNWNDMRFWANETRRRATFTKIRRSLRGLGDDIINAFKDHIIKQDLPWASLSQYTIARKGHGSVYFNTKAYMNGIHRKVTNPGSYTLELRVYPSGMHKPSGLSMTELAAILEDGRRAKGTKVKAIPARPIWKPLFAEITGLPAYKVFATSVTKSIMPRNMV